MNFENYIYCKRFSRDTDRDEYVEKLRMFLKYSETKFLNLDAFYFLETSEVRLFTIDANFLFQALLMTYFLEYLNTHRMEIEISELIKIIAGIEECGNIVLSIQRFCTEKNIYETKFMIRGRNCRDIFTSVDYMIVDEKWKRQI